MNELLIGGWIVDHYDLLAWVFWLLVLNILESSFLLFYLFGVRVKRKKPLKIAEEIEEEEEWIPGVAPHEEKIIKGSPIDKNNLEAEK